MTACPASSWKRRSFQEPVCAHRVVDPGAVGFLERAVENAAAGAAAEGQRRRSLQHLDALRVVEIAEILHVIAKTVDEEVGAGIHAANDEFVAIAFALVHGDAGNVAGDVGETLKTLVLDEVLGDDAERLRNVDQRRIDFGRNRRGVGIDADRAGTRVLRFGERRLWRSLRLGAPRDLRPAPLAAAIGALRGNAAGAAFRFRGGDLDLRKLRSRLRLLCRAGCLRVRRRASERSVAYRKQRRRTQ